MKNTIGIAVFILVVLLLLFLLSSSKKVPPIPSDVLHSGITTDAGCVACHGPAKQAPLKPTHPPKEQCLVCHKTN